MQVLSDLAEFHHHTLKNMVKAAEYFEKSLPAWHEIVKSFSLCLKLKTECTFEERSRLIFHAGGNRATR
jgi:hypothetical protein